MTETCGQSVPRRRKQGRGGERYQKPHRDTQLHFFFFFSKRSRQQLSWVHCLPVRLFHTYISSARCSVLEDQLAGTMNNSCEVAAPRSSCAAIVLSSPRYVAMFRMMCTCASSDLCNIFFLSMYIFGGHKNGVHATFYF